MAEANQLTKTSATSTRGEATTFVVSFAGLTLLAAGMTLFALLDSSPIEAASAVFCGLLAVLMAAMAASHLS